MSYRYYTLLSFFLLTYNLSFGQIAAWSMVSPNTSGNEVTLAARTLDPNLNPATLSRGSGLSPSPLARAFSSRSYSTSSTSLFDAVINQDYIEFQISAASMHQVSLSTLDANFRRSNLGPNMFIWMYSTNGSNFFNASPTISYTAVGDVSNTQTQIDLSSISELQNVPSGTTITFRLYGWGATDSNSTFAIGRLNGNELSIGGTVTLAECPGGSTTWNGSSWNNGTPDLTTEAIIDGNYNTGTVGNLSVCNLLINTGATLTVSNATFVEVENDVTVNGNLSVQSQANFVQNANDGIFTNNGTSTVTKNTPVKADWFYYTYWGSPVTNETIGNQFFDVDGDRRFIFNASNYIDTDGDGIDDNRNDWQFASAADVMTPGVGYAVTSSRQGSYPSARTNTFSGAFNTGVIDTPITFNAANVNESWNFISNPYPCAIDFDAFQTANNTVIGGAAYFWSQASPPDAANPGNSNINFNQNDYAIYASGMGSGTAGGSGEIPTQFIPSGQGFFVAGLANGNATFTNAIRNATTTSNSLFFKRNTLENTNSTNKLWLNLTTANGVFSQILVGYVDGATKANDGLAYDAPRRVNPNIPAVLYTEIEKDPRKYAIQGMASTDLNTDEVINLGFSSTLNTNTNYTLSIAQFEGAFLGSSAIFIKDNYKGIIHNLNHQDYVFTSKSGEFNDRFEIVFNANTLFSNTVAAANNDLKITQKDKNKIQLSATNFSIASVKVYDLLGKLVHTSIHSNKTVYISSVNFSSAPYIAEVNLDNGITVTKKLFVQ